MERPRLVKASAFNLGRMLYGDGSGLLATVSTASGQTVTCDKVNNLIEGMLVDVYTGESVNAKQLKITYVDRVNKTFNFEGTATIKTGDKIYCQGSKGYEITGLGKIFDTTNTSLYGVSVADYPWLKPYVSAPSSNQDISDTLIQEAIDELDFNHDSQVDYIATTAEIRRAYQQYLSACKRNIDVMDLEGGFKTISHNGIPVVADRFVDSGKMFLLNTKDFTLHQLCDWKWLEGENGRILRQNADQPAYSATLVKYAELICDKPCGQALLTKINSTIGSGSASGADDSGL